MKTLIAALGFAIAAATPLNAVAQNDLRSILADTSRPQEHRDQDAGRRPADVLTFFGIESGDQVADLLTGSGYWTRLLVPLVGPTGRVYAGNDMFYDGYYGDAFDALLKEPKFANVVRIDGQVDALRLPAGMLDAALIVLAYHDLYLTGEDRAAMNRAVFAALKPGGVFGVIDHSAAAGSPTSTAEALHRIDEATVVREIQAAGFELDGQANFFRNAADDRSASVFDPSVQGKTDRFVLRFVKPR